MALEKEVEDMISRNISDEKSREVVRSIIESYKDYQSKKADNKASRVMVYIITFCLFGLPFCAFGIGYSTVIFYWVVRMLFT